MKRLSHEQIAAVASEIAISEGRRIVLLDVAGRADLSLNETNSNIYCIDEAGNVLWQVQASGTIYERDSFVYVTSPKAGTIVAARFFGNEFVINPETGEAAHVGWNK